MSHGISRWRNLDKMCVTLWIPPLGDLKVYPIFIKDSANFITGDFPHG
jgi:hypothetical protein